MGNVISERVGKPILEALEPRLLLSGTAGEQAIELFHTTAAVFIENQGQWADESIRFVHKGQGANIAHTDSGPVFDLFREVASDVDGEGFPGDPFDMSNDLLDAEPAEMEHLRFSASFDGANTVTPVGIGQAETRLNFLLGDQDQWRQDVPSYEVVAYEGLYDGIDLHTWGRRAHLKYEFHVAPGADWSQISVSYSGVDALEIDVDGAMHVSLGGGWGEVVDDTPYIYQVIDGQQVEVAGAFSLLDSDTYTFTLIGDYNPAVELIIDPALDWSTYMGGSDNDYGTDIAVDSLGNALVTGYTFSSGWADGGFDTSYSGKTDVFVAKLTPSGGHIWSTYMGGSSYDYGRGIAVDSLGNALVTGSSYSPGWASGGFDTSHNGTHDAFIAKLTPSGGHIWSTYWGGSSTDFGDGIAVDSLGNALVTGSTYSSARSHDAFVIKITPSGGLIWSTRMGGSDRDFGNGIAVDSLGNALVTGETASAGWAGGGYDTSHNGNKDAFVAKLTPSGGLIWSTYMGGGGTDFGNGIAVDSFGNALVTGFTSSSGWAGGGYDTSYNGGTDAFVAKLTPSGGHVWSTYMGRSSSDGGNGIAVDSFGNALVTGSTSSSGWALGGFDTSHNGSNDAFVAKLTPSGGHIWSTYMGGSSSDGGNGIAVDSLGNAFVAGSTESAGWADGGFDTSHNGGPDAFVAKISGAGNPGGTVSISKPGVAVSEWGSSEAACEASDSQWADEGGMVLDPSIWTSTEATPVYRFHLPEADATAGAMTNLVVSVYGRGRDWALEPSLWAGPEGDRLELTGSLPEVEGWSELFAVPLDKLEEAPGSMPGYTLGVVIDAQHYGVAWDWYDVKTLQVSYTYAGIDAMAMQEYQIVLDGAATLLRFYEEVAQNWPLAALNPTEIVQKLMPSWQAFLGAATDNSLWQALMEGVSLVSDLEILGDTIGWAFDWTDFMTKVNISFKNPANSAYAELEDLAERWWGALDDDGFIDDAESAEINGDISAAVSRLDTLEDTLTEAGQNLRNIINNAQPDETEVVNSAKAGLAVLSTMLRFDPETGAGPLQNSYLPALKQQLTALMLNLAPTNISLSSTSAPEDTPVGSVVGSLSTSDPYDVGSHSYEFVAGDGDDDNSRFSIVGDVLKTAVPLDYEGQDTFVIRVRSTDQGGLSTEKELTVNVTNVNESPSNIRLSSNSILENQPVGTVLGSFSTDDPDVDDVQFIYTLVSGAGSGDNGSFSIVGDTLRTAASFNYEAKNGYSIRVQTADLGGLLYEDAFTITVTNINEQPTNISLSNNTIPENEPAVTLVGTLSTTDPDANNVHAYTFVPGTGDDDNALFIIDGDTLKTVESFDYETKNTYSILVRSTDAGGLYTDKAFSISVINLVDTDEYQILVSQFGLTGDGLAADLNGDGRVDLADFAITRAHFGNVLPAQVPPTAPEVPVADSQTVVEPATEVAILKATSEPIAAVTAPAVQITSQTLDDSVKNNPDDHAIPAMASAPAIDLTVESPHLYLTERLPISIGLRTSVVHRAATAEYDLRPLSGDMDVGESDDLLVDILAESALALPL